MLEYITNGIDELTVNKDMACLEMHENEEAKHVYEQSVLHMKKLTVEKKKYNQKLRTLKVTLKEQQQLRGNDSNGLQYLLIEVLEQCNIQKQHFHGGSMNGVCCRRLLDNSGKIFEKIKEITAKRLGTNRYRNSENDKQLLTEVIDKFEYLFELTDVVFSHLRIITPTEYEIADTERAIYELEKVWTDMEIYFTPKAHILFDHTMNQIRFFEGIADLVEDFIERSHQYGKNLII